MDDRGREGKGAEDSLAWEGLGMAQRTGGRADGRNSGHGLWGWCCGTGDLDVWMAE